MLVRPCTDKAQPMLRPYEGCDFFSLVEVSLIGDKKVYVYLHTLHTNIDRLHSLVDLHLDGLNGQGSQAIIL